MRPKISYFLLSAFVVLLPLLVVSAILALRFNKNLLDHAPFYSDELYHWHQSRSFARFGLNNGYYTFNENTPIASFSHYYAWGMWPYFYYGILGRLFGFGLNALALVNTLTFMAATGFYIWSVRPSWGRLLCLGAVLASFIPLLLYLPSSLLEPLSMAIVMIFAAGFYHLLNRQVSQRFVWGMAAFSVLAGLIRPTFALYLFPLFVLAEEKRDFKAIVFAAVKSIPLILLSAFGFYLTAAPFPHFRSILFLGDEPLGVKLANFTAYVQQSFVWLFTVEGMDSVVVIQRAQIALLLLLLAGWGGVLSLRAADWTWRNEKDRGMVLPPSPNGEGLGVRFSADWHWELALHLYNLLGFYLATIFFHETYGGHDFRVMAVHLLFSLVLLAVMRGQWMAGILVLSSLLVMQPVWDYFGWKDANFGGYVQAQYEEWQPRLDDFLVYDADAPSPWCNTLLSSGFYLQNAEGQPGLLLSVDAGFGLSWAGNWSFAGFEIAMPERFLIPSQFQARYLLLTEGDYEAWGQALHLQRLMDAPSGALYLNEDESCEE